MSEQKKKKCFVVMGFGLKTDFATGRTLDLDKTYQQIIKKAVEAAGLECIRADDIIHSGVIDKPMYELLLEADVVVADLSTSNVNAVYELGVRHALKPNTTIIIAEKQFKFPFDIGHIAIRMYEHLGNGIEEKEAERMRKNLKETIMYLVDKPDTDSPVYTFLPTLNTPTIGQNVVNRTVSEALVQSQTQPETKAQPQPEATPDQTPVDDGSAALIADLFAGARKDGNWDLALNLLFQLLVKRPGEIYINSILSDLFMEARKKENWLAAIDLLKKLLVRRPGDVYLKQQLALATYKSKKPTLEEALNEAKKILSQLNPYQTTDPETLGLWGAVHKRLWEVKGDSTFLDESIWAYEKGFIVKNDFYNGINFAYLLNARASVSNAREALGDIVLAERVRRKVIEICTNILEKKSNPRLPTEFIENAEQKFWLEASMVEAYFGIGDIKTADKIKKKISKSPPESWMIGSMNEQLEKLKKFMEMAPKIG
ncbi:MAG: TRAFs-binding domain-containing protein [Bacteroidia bacterium]